MSACASPGDAGTTSLPRRAIARSAVTCTRQRALRISGRHHRRWRGGRTPRQRTGRRRRGPHGWRQSRSHGRCRRRGVVDRRPQARWHSSHRRTAVAAIQTAHSGAATLSQLQLPRCRAGVERYRGWHRTRHDGKPRRHRDHRKGAAYRQWHHQRYRSPRTSPCRPFAHQTAVHLTRGLAMGGAEGWRRWCRWRCWLVSREFWRASHCWRSSGCRRAAIAG